ncbi:hypothetical protein CFK39_09385 [Brachybacterium avium]|uniref:RNA-binding protein n=1 Tax=Brachybacterium avium TaxID=2017485 RepID=A0A220UCR7_9MICO|nr:hypothetical protein [Brachybacterium avium]ASK65998.1 hypothetical protein CFK39_09385 [Brachybacterium avium]
MALIHPRSLERWQEWRGSRRRARGIHRARPSESAPGYVLHLREGEGSARILLGIDTADGAAHGGLPAVLPYVHGSAVVVTPAGLALDELEGPEWQHRRIARPSDALDELGITSVLTLGWHLEVGRSLHEWARERDVPGAVVQHDVLTPFAPPLPPDTTVLSWTAEDGEFHRAGRDDIAVRVVGSQRLWQARHEAAGEAPVLEEQPVFLGQFSSIELPRRVSLRAAESYCRFAGALYQPGPAETERLARAAHLLLRRRGIGFQDPSITVAEQARPLASVFSADILEAAMRGIPAWVHAPGAPSWVGEHWERYGMRRVGAEPTPPPGLGTDEPARLIAQILEGGA